MNSIHLSVATITYVLILIGALFFPFDFSNPEVRTDVRWLTDSEGIEISSTSIIRSEIPPQKLYDSLVSGDGITLEIWLAAKDNKQDGPARIISYSYDKYLRNFTLGQEGEHLVMRLRTTQTDLNGKPALVVNNVFIPNMRQHLVVTYNYSHETVYIDGKKRLTSKMHSGSISNWDSSYLFMLGNESTGNRPWLGRIYKVAIYSQALTHQEVLQNFEAGIASTSENLNSGHYVSDDLVATYLFNERTGNMITDKSGIKPALDLYIPEKMKVADKDFLRSPYKNFVFDMQNITDMVVNVIIFIPFGFLLSIVVRQRINSLLIVMGLVLAVGILFTLTIETIQYFISSRYSSLTDAMNNTIGILLGINLSQLYSYVRK